VGFGVALNNHALNGLDSKLRNSKDRGELHRILGSFITQKKLAVFLAKKHNISIRLSARVKLY
jgi:hypothetical protein